MQTEPNHFIFVYGTLMKGESNHSLIAREAHQFLGYGRTAKPYHMRFLQSAFPIVFEEGNPKANVLGEMYSVNNETLARLDRLENNGSMYERKFVDITHVTKGYYQCLMYFGIQGYWKGSLQALNVPKLTTNNSFSWRV